MSQQADSSLRIPQGIAMSGSFCEANLLTDQQNHAAEKIILRWDSTASDNGREGVIFDGDRAKADEYLRAVDEIQKSRSINEKKAAGAIQIAMARLEDEFRRILSTHSNPPEMESLMSRSSSSLSSISTDTGDEEASQDESVQVGRSRSRSLSIVSLQELDLVPSEAISDLRTIAKRMIASGYLRECIQAYGSVRKSVMESSIRQLGIEKLSIGEVQKLEWDVLETKIRGWIRAAKVCVRVLFASERLLCERIFEELAPKDDDVEETCFMETVKGAAIQLLNFAEAISISRRSPEKLFKILDLQEAVSDLLPDILSLFRSPVSEMTRIQVSEILSRLAEAARGVLSEFENAVLRENSKIVPGGTVHPLTRYVMNYLVLISDYREPLLELIISRPQLSGVGGLTDELTPLSVHLIWTIRTLELNLQAKTELHKDAALSHLFLMNNTHYIVQKIKGSPELRKMIGDDYLKRLTWKYRQSATGYERASWGRILSCLREEGLHVTGGFSSGVSKTVLRERFKSFNSAFEDAHRVQLTWLVPDTQLREELRISIAEKLLPAYRAFLGRFRNHLESSKHSETCIKYSVEDLETSLLDFFEGPSVPTCVRKKSH